MQALSRRRYGLRPAFRSDQPGRACDHRPPSPYPAGEIVLNALSWILNLHGESLHLWPVWLISFLIYQLPYALLLWRLNRRPDTPAIAFALALPSISLLSGLYTLLTLFHLFTNQTGAVARTVIFSAIDVVIFLFALRVRKLRPAENEAKWLPLAVALTFAYFLLTRLLVPLLYRAF